MRGIFTGMYVVLAAVLILIACQSGSSCRDIVGPWSDREGHDFVFTSDGKALWLNRFGQLVDTVSCVFVLNCKVKPATLDFTAFSNGPFKDKTLFGIIEWSADSLFRYCYEVGVEPGCRPKKFDQMQTMKFYRRKAS